MPENESAEKPRVRSLDMYKGIAILGVIAVHVFIFPTMQQGEAEGSGMPLVVQALYLGLLDSSPYPDTSTGRTAGSPTTSRNAC